MGELDGNAVGAELGPFEGEELSDSDEATQLSYPPKKIADASLQPPAA
jgi:hypothetical protein